MPATINPVPNNVPIKNRETFARKDLDLSKIINPNARAPETPRQISRSIVIF